MRSPLETTRPFYPRDEEQYVRGAQAGKAVLSVVVQDTSLIHRVVTILELHQPLEMEEETDEADETGADFSAAALPSPSTAPSAADLSSPGMGLGSTSLTDNEPRDTSASGTEEVIPLAEEQIEVGKRTVDRGITRVRRYVVERPVEQEVTLRGERVTIERRRPMDTTGAPDRAFEERVVEVHETEEVPVVAKTARIVEEVTIGKQETERTETVRDTVRREDIEVTDEQGRQASKP